MRIIKRGKDYVIQNRFLGFLFWTDAETDDNGFYFSYPTFKKAKQRIKEYYQKDKIITN